MWQLLLAVVVAGTTCFATNHFFYPGGDTVQNANSDAPNDQQSGSERASLTQNGSPSRPKQRKSHRWRQLFSWKRRKSSNDIAPAAKAPFCSSEGNSLFGLGLCFGIMFMMSARKAEIDKLNKTMDESAKLVQELRSELKRRKSSCTNEISESVTVTDMDSCKTSGRHEVMLKKTNSEFRDSGVIIWSPAVNDSGECGSSAVTEESEPGVPEMDQLEAELEFELQKLSGCTNDSLFHEEMKPKFEKAEALDEGSHGTDDWSFNYPQSYGVPASELYQKLSQLLIKQQEDQIKELESKLHQVKSKLHEKEAELRALKDCVRHLTELPLSTVSDDETQTLTVPKAKSNCENINVESDSKQMVLGAKRRLDSESCSCYM